MAGAAAFFSTLHQARIILGEARKQKEGDRILRRQSSKGGKLTKDDDNGGEGDNNLFRHDKHRTKANKGKKAQEGNEAHEADIELEQCKVALAEAEEKNNEVGWLYTQMAQSCLVRRERTEIGWSYFIETSEMDRETVRVLYVSIWICCGQKCTRHLKNNACSLQYEFSDRPERKAGVVDTDYFFEWFAYNFLTSRPNAVVTMNDGDEMDTFEGPLISVFVDAAMIELVSLLNTAAEWSDKQRRTISQLFREDWHG